MAKDKPIKPKDLDPEQKEVMQFVDYHWNEGPVVKNYHGKWEEYIKWFEGDQYTFYNPNSGKVENVAALVDREVKNVYNRILPNIRQQHGEILYPHSFYVEPNTTESDDVKAAKIGSSIIEYTNNLRNFKIKINRGKWWGLIVGDFFWKEFWNKNLYGIVKKGDHTAKEKGDVDYDFINPFNVRPDPYAKGRDGWRFIVVGDKVPKTAVEEEFGLDYGTLPPEEGNDSKGHKLFERTNQSKDKKEETVIRKEYYVRPCKKYPNGLYMVTASGWILYWGENTCPDHDIPIFQIPGILPILGEQWHDSAVRLAQPGQRQLNRYGSQIDEYLQNYRPKGMIPRGTFPKGEKEIFTREKGIDYCEFNPTAGNPYWMNPPQPPSFLVNWLQFQENEISTETSVREASQGQLPKYATRPSFQLYEGLLERDQAVLASSLNEINNSLQQAHSYRLKLVQKHYSVPRVVKITGKAREISSVFVKGTDLRNNTDVKVKSGVELFSQKKAKRQTIETFVEKGLIDNPKEALELLGEERFLEDYYEEEFIDERQARRENEMIKEGETYPVPDPDDVHDVHLRIHDNERKKEEFRSWPDKAKDNLKKHKDEHKALQGQEAAQTAPEAQPAEGQTAAPAPSRQPAPGPPPAPTPAPPAGGEVPTIQEVLAQLAGGGR